MPPTASSKDSKCGKKRKWLQANKYKDDKTRHLEIGWLHQRSSNDDCVVVRGDKEAGTRNVEMALTSRKWDIISYGKKLFFPVGKTLYARRMRLFLI